MVFDIIYCLTLIPAFIFMADKTNDFVYTLSGLSIIPVFTALWLLGGAVVCAVLIRKGWIKNLCGKGAAAAVVNILFIIVSVFLPGFLGENNIILRIGGGAMLGTYLYTAVSMLASIRVRPRLQKERLAYIGIVFGIAVFAGAVYISQSSYIYYWDTANYWITARNIASGEVFEHFFSDLYDSILTMDYNYLAGLLSAIFAWIFGGSRTVFILSIIICYYVPSAYIIYGFCQKAKHPVVLAAAIMLGFPVILFLGISGFVDIGGLVACLACFRLYRAQRYPIQRYFFIGLLLAAIILFRRWYAFFSVSFLVAMAVDILVMKKDARLFLVSVFSAGMFLGAFFMPLVTGKLLTDYSALYEGYQFALSVDFKLFTRYFGLILPAVLLTGTVIYSVRCNRSLIFCWIQMIVCFLLFVRTQTHGQQHLLLYIPSLLIITAALIEQLGKIGTMAALLSGCIICANTFIDRKQPESISEISHYALIPDFSMLPRTRDDIPELLEIKGYLDDLCPNGETVGVLASSFRLNKDLLENIEMSFNIIDEHTSQLVELPAVDSRDSDFSALYNVDYILVAFPAQTHLAPENQRVVTEAVRSFEENTDIATAYEEDGVEFEIDGMRVKIYKKLRPNTEAEIAEFESRVKQR